MPSFSDDDVLDFMVTEAVVTRMGFWRARQQRQQKAAEEAARFRNFEDTPGTG